MATSWNRPVSRAAQPLAESQTAITLLFEEAPVLVEVRFPSMGTAPDWYLSHTQEELDTLIQRLASGAELHLSSVWDLKNEKGALVVRK